MNKNIKYKGKYRIASARLKNFDYASKGAYFITICTKNRVLTLGNIKNSQMSYSDQGKIVHDIWQKIPEQFAHVDIGDFVIMPNHIHGIIIINDVVETRFIASHKGGITKEKNPMLQQNLSTIIRWFKGRTTFKIRKNKLRFSWQARFHDRIIRDEAEWQSYNDYIQTNPLNWEKDEHYITTLHAIHQDAINRVSTGVDHDKIMGIVNITPDSFSDGGDFYSDNAETRSITSLAQAQKLINDSASIIDIGAQSTHPDAKIITTKQEWQRLAPLFPQITRLGVQVSVDTFRSEVAQKALENGAHIINDVTALRGDEKMIDVLRQSDCKVVLMYNRNNTLTAQRSEENFDPIIAVSDFFTERIQHCQANGIDPQRLILDPGAGFFLSSKPDVTFELLRRVPELIEQFSQPILLGVSRKSFLRNVSHPTDAKQRTAASAITEAIAINNGVSIIRTHDVAATQKVLNIFCTSAIHNPQSKIYLGLGSNLGDRAQYLTDALVKLSQHRQINVITSSNLYHSTAWGKTDQPDFVNIVIEIETSLAPDQLLTVCKQIENQLGRIKRQHWGPREIDIDILFWGDQTIAQEHLQIPHPYAYERDFVINPLREIAPTLEFWG